MKKLSIFLLALLSGTGTMFASDTSVDGIWYKFNNGNLTAEVTFQGAEYYSYSNEYSGEVVIPSSVTYNAQTYTVTRIGDDAFAYCSGLTSVTIPNSVTSIGRSAFEGCSGLTSVTIPNSVTSFGSSVFYKCSGLTSLSVEAGNTVYDSRNNCNAIIKTSTNTLIFGCQNTTIPNSVTSIGDEAFEYCSGLTSVTIPNSVTIIGERAFEGCSSLTSVTIGNSVTIIGDYAFRDCIGLTSVTIPNSVTSIGTEAFVGCRGLTSVKIGNSVRTIGFAAFQECTNITSIDIPGCVTTIEANAFNRCSALTSITIPNNVTSIEQFVFYDCTSLKSVILPSSLTSIEAWAFYCCTGITSVTNYATTPQTLNGDVFYNVDKSTCKLYVPLESIILYQTAQIWSDFENIEAISIIASGTCGDEGDNLTWELSNDGILTITGNGKMADWPNNGNVPWFEHSSNIVSVVLNDGITSIGNYAFYACRSLTSVTIPGSVTRIGDYAFEASSSLTSVTIPNGVTSIGTECFAASSASFNVAADNPNYSSLDGVLFDKEKTTLIQCPSSKQGTYVIPSSVTILADYAFAVCHDLTSITIPNSITSIGTYTFYDCTGLTSITIPKSITNIKNNSFYRCSNLTSVHISDLEAWCAINFLGSYSNPLIYAHNLYLNETLITDLVIPNDITSIGKSVFSGCSSLTSVTIPNSVTSIGESAFSSCSGLTSVTIPNSVTSIGNYAFQNCSGLTSVTIPNSVTSFGNWAFAWCTGLTSITNYATTPQSINSNVFEYVNKSTCVLNVPKESVSLYQAAEVWKDFWNIVGVDVPGEDPEEPIETVEGDYTINYVDKDSQALYNHVVTLYVPVAATITGFTFVKWRAFADDIEDGITLQAVYQSNIPTNAPAVYTDPANPAQKLIKNGNVYILTDDKTYTVTGQQVK